MLSNKKSGYPPRKPSCASQKNRWLCDHFVPLSAKMTAWHQLVHGVIVMIFLACATPLLGGEQREFSQVKLPDGRMIENVRVLDSGDFGVIVKHDGGLETFGREDLPQELRGQLGILPSSSSLRSNRIQLQEGQLLQIDANKKWVTIRRLDGQEGLRLVSQLSDSDRKRIQEVAPQFWAFDAVRLGDGGWLSALLDEGLDPDVRNHNGEPLLFAAAKILPKEPEGPLDPFAAPWHSDEAQMEIMELLLRHGANPNVFCHVGPDQGLPRLAEEGQTPLEVARENRNIAVERILINGGADPALRSLWDIIRDYRACFVEEGGKRAMAARKRIQARDQKTVGTESFDDLAELYFRMLARLQNHVFSHSIQIDERIDSNLYFAYVEGYSDRVILQTQTVTFTTRGKAYLPLGYAKVIGAGELESVRSATILLREMDLGETPAETYNHLLEVSHKIAVSLVNQDIQRDEIVGFYRAVIHRARTEFRETSSISRDVRLRNEHYNVSEETLDLVRVAALEAIYRRRASR